MKIKIPKWKMVYEFVGDSKESHEKEYELRIGDPFEMIIRLALHEQTSLPKMYHVLINGKHIESVEGNLAYAKQFALNKACSLSYNFHSQVRDVWEKEYKANLKCNLSSIVAKHFSK